MRYFFLCALMLSVIPAIRMTREDSSPQFKLMGGDGLTGLGSIAV